MTKSLTHMPAITAAISKHTAKKAIRIDLVGKYAATTPKARKTMKPSMVQTTVRWNKTPCPGPIVATTWVFRLETITWNQTSILSAQNLSQDVAPCHHTARLTLAYLNHAFTRPFLRGVWGVWAADALLELLSTCSMVTKGVLSTRGAFCSDEEVALPLSTMPESSNGMRAMTKVLVFGFTSQ
jgi:hypothetical protein